MGARLFILIRLALVLVIAFEKIRRKKDSWHDKIRRLRFGCVTVARSTERARVPRVRIRENGRESPSDFVVWRGNGFISLILARRQAGAIVITAPTGKTLSLTRPNEFCGVKVNAALLPAAHSVTRIILIVIKAVTFTRT